MRSIQHYFLTKKEAKELTTQKEKIATEIKKKEEEIKKKEEEEEKFWISYWKQQEENTRKLVNSTYIMLRYWISIDGTMKTFIWNHANPYIRRDRELFLEDQDNKTVVEHINTIVSYNNPKKKQKISNTKENNV